MLQDTLISESLQQFTATSGREETLLFEELFHLLRTSSIMVVTALSSSHLCICCASWQACAFSRSAYILDSHHCTYLLVCLIRLKKHFYRIAFGALNDITDTLAFTTNRIVLVKGQS